MTGFENAAQERQITESTARNAAAFVETPQGNYWASKIEAGVLASFLAGMAYLGAWQWAEVEFQRRLALKDEQISRLTTEINGLQRDIEIARATTENNRCFSILILSAIAPGKWQLSDACRDIVNAWLAKDGRAL